MKEHLGLPHAKSVTYVSGQKCYLCRDCTGGYEPYGRIIIRNSPSPSYPKRGIREEWSAVSR
jgi:hypothetical protein